MGNAIIVTERCRERSKGDSDEVIAAKKITTEPLVTRSIINIATLSVLNVFRAKFFYPHSQRRKKPTLRFQILAKICSDRRRTFSN